MDLEQIKVQIFPDGRLDTVNAARYSGFSTHHLARMRLEGNGPKFIKRGGRIFYRKEVLDAWINEFDDVSSNAEARVRKAQAEAA